MLIKRGAECIGVDEPLFRLVLIRVNTQPSCLAVLLTLSHVIADGHTGRGGHAAAGAARGELHGRCLESSVALQLIGFSKYTFLIGSAQVLRWRRSAGCTVARSSRVLRSVWLSDSWLDTTTTPPGGSVNTHEMLLWWLAPCRARIRQCSTESAQHRPGVTDDHAGHYAGGYLLSREHLDAPINLAIHTLMRTEIRRGDDWPGPSVKQRLYPRFGIVSNWSTIHRELVLPGCELVLHMPVLSPMPSPRGSVGLVIFQATEDQLGSLSWDAVRK